MKRALAALGPALAPRLWTSCAMLALGLAVGLLLSRPHAGATAGSVVAPPVLELFGRNLGVGVMLAAGGALAGIPTVLCLLGNGLVAGLVAGSLVRVPGGAELAAVSILPHGVLELPAFALFGAAGLGVAAHTLKVVGASVEAPSGSRLAREFLAATALLAVAALLECLVTPALLNARIAGAALVDPAVLRWVAVAAIAVLPYLGLRALVLRLVRRSPHRATLIGLAMALAAPVAAVGVAAAALQVQHEWVQARAAASGGRIDANILQVLALTLAVGAPTLLGLTAMALRARLPRRAGGGMAADPLQRAALLTVFVAGAVGLGTAALLHRAGVPPVFARGLAPSLGVALAFVVGPLLVRRALPRDDQPADALRLRPALRVLERAGAPRHRLRVVRTGPVPLANALATGVVPGRLEIVLTRALVEALEPDEVAAVAAHEAGHLARHHLRWMMLAGVGLSTASAALLNGVGALLARAPTGAAAGIGFVTAASLLSVLVLPASMAWLMRRCERDADRFAARMGCGPALARALEKLALVNGWPRQASRLERVFALHLPVAERAAALLAGGGGDVLPPTPAPAAS